jgi:hypothetical protein
MEYSGGVCLVGSGWTYFRNMRGLVLKYEGVIHYMPDYISTITFKTLN